MFPYSKSCLKVARTKVVNKDRIWAHPALSDGRLYLRDEKHLICLDLRRE